MAKSWKSLLKNNNFVYVWISQILSQITINILNYAILFTLFEKTGSTIATSLVWIFYTLPAIIVGPFASAFVDMADRRKMLVYTNLIQSLIVIFYALSSDTSQYFVYAIVLIYSAVNQFYVPAEFATLPFVTRKKSLPEANALFLITQQGSLIFGFGIAGIFLKIIGFQSTLVICSLLLFFAFISTLFLPRMESRQKIPTGFDKAVITFFRNIFSGYKFISENKLVLAPFLIMICMQIALAILAVNAPAIAIDVVKIPLSYAGAFLIIPGGIGAMVASLIIPKMLRNGLRKIKIIKYSLLFLASFLFIWIFIFAYLNLILRLVSSFFLIAAMGFTYIGILIPTQTFLQQKTPFGLRGRVFGNYWFLVTVVSVFPVIASGTITEIFGIKSLMAILIIGILTLYWFLRLKERQYLLPEDYI